ncbi:DUF6773 family protein [Clostridium intestinale]|uniref:DUF6773 family protein n=1 Tax=Clostridium intestinale TaxID=36845 RepID=UPI0028E7B30B|nr:DUF6773 family protein [Clostridium intestinale]
MKSLKNQDERILISKRKIQSDAFQLLIGYLLIAIMIKKFLFNGSFYQIGVELAGVIGAVFFVRTSNIFLGNDIYPKGNNTWKNIIISDITSGLFSCIILFVLAGITDIAKVAYIFIGTTICFLVITFLSYYLNKRKQEEIEKELDSEDEDIFK